MDQDHILGQPCSQPDQRIFGQECAGRIGRIGNEDNSGSCRDGVQNGVNVDHPFAFRDGDGVGSDHLGKNRIHRKTMFRGDDLIPDTGIGLGDELQHLIRSHAADDAIGVKTVHLADRLTQGA